MSLKTYEVVHAKVDLQTQRANTRNGYPKRASRFDLLIDKDEVTAKRYSRGTRGSSKIAMQLAESMRTRKKEKVCKLTKSPKSK